MKWFRTCNWSEEKIEEVEVERETENCVYLVDRWGYGAKGKVSRTAKHSNFESYFPTWEEAHQFLITKFKSKLDAARVSVTCAEKDLNEILGMKRPEPCAPKE